MTVIIKGDTTLSNPTPGYIILPDLGVSGIVARFNARTLIGVAGDAISQVPDASGNGRNLALVSGTPQIGVRSGVKTISLAAGATLASADYTGISLQRTLSLAGYFGGNAAATNLTFQSFGSAGGGAISHLNNGRFASYGNASPFPSSAVVTKPAWLRVIATLDSAGSVGKIVVNGVIVSGTIAVSGTPGTKLSLVATAAMLLEVVDATMFDHVLSDVEIGVLDASLAAQLV